MSLTLRDYAGQATDRDTVRIFRDWVHACAHLCDHVLTMPEAEGWALILEGYRETCESNARFRLAKSLWSDEGESAQWLYDLYAGAIADVLDAAVLTGWVWIDRSRMRSDYVAFGPSGVLTIWSEGHVRTAMLPGTGRPLSNGGEESEDVDERRRNPLPRETAERGAGSPDGRDWRHGRGGSGEPEEHRRYRLFRNCARFVRSNWLASYEEVEHVTWPTDLMMVVADMDEWTRLGELR